MSLTHFLHDPFLQFSFVFFAVFVVASLMRLFRQPLIVGFIITGILVSPSLLPLADGLQETMAISSELGVVLLLFLAGLHLNPYFLKTEGKSILLAGLGQIIITGALAFGFLHLWDFTLMEYIYLTIALTLSSTIITLKLLSDTKQLTHLHGRLSIGILLLQDIFVAISLIVFNALDSEGSSLPELVLVNSAVLVVVLVPAFLIQRYVLPRLLPLIARSQEYFFVFVISWLLLFATIFDIAGFSSEVGALLGGVMLAPTLFASEINSKIKPLRDFFLILFFIFLGQQIGLDSLATNWSLLVGASLFVIIVKPIVVLLVLGTLGYKYKVAAKTAFSLAQISEFSLILIVLGISTGDVSTELLALVTLVMLISITFSTYLIKFQKQILHFLAPLLKLTEIGLLKPKSVEKKVYTPKIILIGAKLTGRAIITTLEKSKKDFLVIDFNPEIIKSLRNKYIDCIYGDLFNFSKIDEIEYDEANFIISTVSDLEANLAALNFITKNYKHVPYLCYAVDDTDAIQLYKNGASYVLVPHHVGGKFVATLIKDLQDSPESFIEQKLAHLKLMDN